jgi:hypothetical protein
MLQDIVLWTTVLAVLTGLGAAFAFPRTRPYAKKYWWVGVAIAAGALAMVLLRRRGGHSTDKAVEEGRQIAKDNVTALDTVIDHALEQQARADVELTRARFRAESAREKIDAELEAVALVDDSLERRKALIAIAGKHK